MTMNILHAYVIYDVSKGGGTSDLLHKIVRSQIELGHTVRVLTTEGYISDQLRSELPKNTIIGCKTWWSVEGLWISIDLFIRGFKSVRWCDVVHLHAYRTFQSAVLWTFATFLGKKIIMDAHGSTPSNIGRKQLLKRMFDLLIGRRILRNSVLVAETQVGVDEYYQVLGDAEENIIVLSPPFSTREFDGAIYKNGAVRRRFGLSNDDILLGYLGRFNEIKGLEFLIRGFAEYLKRSDRKIYLAMMGYDDGYEERARQLSDELGVSHNICWYGFVSGELKRDCLADIDVKCQLSKIEQGAWASFEAVLCGTPVIVTRHTGAGEDVRKLDCGILVEQDNTGDFCAALDEMLLNYSDYRRKAATAGDFIRSKLSFSARGTDYIKLYKGV
jgi:glycosyltransferase involved in cell wall biosynthesis